MNFHSHLGATRPGTAPRWLLAVTACVTLVMQAEALQLQLKNLLGPPEGATPTSPP
jgi:hypothetical protein